MRTPPLPALLVFSDLDGTLLDHTTYDWSPAKPALIRLASLGAGLVLASSKTAAEIRPLQSDIDAATGIGMWPAIVENGAGVIWPQDDTASTNHAYEEIRDTLRSLPSDVSLFRGFGDMTVDEVAEQTGLPLEQAKLAKERQFSEPGVWEGTVEALQAFQSVIADHGLHARQGGRFLTLSFGHTKADAMANIIGTVQPQTTIALGDAPNDREMLEAADWGVVVRNPHGKPLPPLQGEDGGQIIHTESAGPSGWAEAILSLTARLTQS